MVKVQCNLENAQLLLFPIYTVRSDEVLLFKLLLFQVFLNQLTIIYKIRIVRRFRKKKEKSKSSLMREI